MEKLSRNAEFFYHALCIINCSQIAGFPMPLRKDPRTNYQRLNELSEEFTEHWSQIRALYLDAAVGFSFVRQHIESLQERARSYARGTELDTEEFQDTCNFLYSELLPESFVTAGIQLDKQGDIKRRNNYGGGNFVTLGHYCIVSFYTFWEEYLRREYAVAKGLLDKDVKDQSAVDLILKQHVRSDLWGDIGLFRNAIVHNHGKAGENISKCKVFKWFQPGDDILVTPERMRELLLALLQYRNELFLEQFPPRYIQL